ncbi:hypothetical protein ECANGB1_28 [Enterospora canceri]|uniref:Uncharacterized protein n=1 Tax=Enterospora canceri TaxID=1081671 RepID=A0A1Y1S8I0_9MICR|nr:hypothetical protein ECANGB1_28 [Enterospora canceri]
MLFSPRVLQLLYQFKEGDDNLPGEDLLADLLDNKTTINMKLLYKVLYSFKKLNLRLTVDELNEAGIKLSKLKKNTSIVEQFANEMEENENFKQVSVIEGDREHRLYISSDEIEKLYIRKLEKLILVNFVRRKTKIDDKMVDVCYCKKSKTGNIAYKPTEFGYKNKVDFISKLPEENEVGGADLPNEQDINITESMIGKVASSNTTIKVMIKQKKQQIKLNTAEDRELIRKRKQEEKEELKRIKQEALEAKREQVRKMKEEREAKRREFYENKEKAKVEKKQNKSKSGIKLDSFIREIEKEESNTDESVVSVKFENKDYTPNNYTYVYNKNNLIKKTLRINNKAKNPITYQYIEFPYVDGKRRPLIKPRQENYRYFIRETAESINYSWVVDSTQRIPEVMDYDEESIISEESTTTIKTEEELSLGDEPNALFDDKMFVNDSNEAEEITAVVKNWNQPEFKSEVVKITKL